MVSSHLTSSALSCKTPASTFAASLAQRELQNHALLSVSPVSIIKKYKKKNIFPFEFLSLNKKKKLLFEDRATIEQSSQHPDSLRYIQQLEDYSKYQRQESAEEQSAQRPIFIRPLQDLGELQEGRNAHFEAQLTPVSDPTMKVEWYKDGRHITASTFCLSSLELNYFHSIMVFNFPSGSRITTIFNFGYVSLNIMHLRAEDAGSYTVRAVNRLGEAISTGTLSVLGKLSIV